MPVYMIRCGEIGPVKIGHTIDVVKRLCELQVAHWETLRVLRLFEGGETEEAMLHSRFAELHLRGEWHSYSLAMLGDLGLVEIIQPVTEVPTIISGATAVEIGQKIAALRSGRRLTQAEVAAEIGISRSTLASIEKGHDFPGRVTLVRLAGCFGVPFGDLA